MRMSKPWKVWVWLENNRIGHYYPAVLVCPFALTPGNYGEAEIRFKGRSRYVAQYRIRMRRPKDLDFQYQPRRTA